MKKLLLLVLSIVMIVGGLTINKTRVELNKRTEMALEVASDSYIRDRVVMLKGDTGGCSGIEIAGPSGLHYILTARHCQKISSTGIIDATLENGIIKKVRIIDISKSSDLMLLSPADNKTIQISDKVELYEHIHSLTHGGMRPTFRTDGMMLKPEKISFPISRIETNEEMDKCAAAPNQRVEMTLFGGFCVVELRLNMTTAPVIGGSSGGPVLNDAGQLIGIVSGTDGFFSAIVTLEDIHKFLADK